MIFTLKITVLSLFLGFGNAKSFTTKWTPRDTSLNSRPIVGILFQEDFDQFGVNIGQYLSTSYVKFVEQGGARVVCWVCCNILTELC